MPTKKKLRKTKPLQYDWVELAKRGLRDSNSDFFKWYSNNAENKLLGLPHKEGTDGELYQMFLHSKVLR